MLEEKCLQLNTPYFESKIIYFILNSTELDCDADCIVLDKQQIKQKHINEPRTI